MLLVPAGMATATATAWEAGVAKADKVATTVTMGVEMMEMSAMEDGGENPKVRMDITASDQTALAQMVW